MCVHVRACICVSFSLEFQGKAMLDYKFQELGMLLSGITFALHVQGPRFCSAPQ